MKFIVLAGGAGTKLWPLSKENYPKQFSKIIGNKSLLRLTVADLLDGYDAKDIYISTTALYTKYVKAQLPEIPKKNYIIEPHIRKNSGPATCFAMAHLLKDFPDEVVMFNTQAVVIRSPRSKFLRMTRDINDFVTKTKKFVTTGIIPTHAETGSDYLELYDVPTTQGNLNLYQSKAYLERPKTLQEAKTLISTKKIFTHSNHYTWTPREFFDHLKVHKPQWHEISLKVVKEIRSQNFEKIYAQYEAGRIEEFTKNLLNQQKAFVAHLPFNWYHITTWNDVLEFIKRQESPTTQGKVVNIDSNNNLIINKTNKLVTTIGIKDAAIIATDEETLICNLNDVGKITELLERIAEEGYKNHL